MAGSHLTGNGPGNGNQRRTNVVKRSAVYEDCRSRIEARYPRLKRERFFPSLETYMVICEVEKRADRVGGLTYILNTPDDFDPPITLYFTYSSGVVKLQAVHADA